jgi:phosphoribosylaminoimidazole carboxylase, PurE protein
MMKVAVIMGSASDLGGLREMINFVKEFDVEVSVDALSAHRTHEELSSLIGQLNQDETDVIIAAAGKAAHLPGVIAAKTIKPVIGVPVKASTLDGLDALLSIVQMPKGIPVATVAIDGGMNAGILALEIMAVKYDGLKDKLLAYRKQMQQECLEANAKVKAEFN